MVVMRDVSGIEGFELCRGLRRDPRFASVPIILMSALQEAGDRIKGLDEGADDYVSKPFDLAELKARIRAVLRRTGERRPDGTDVSPTLGPDTLRLDLKAKSLDVRGAGVSVTRAEFALIAFLAGRPGEVFSARQLLNEVWGYPPGTGEPDLVRWHIRNIRKKIELDPRHPVVLRTVRQYGYMLDPGHRQDTDGS